MTLPIGFQFSQNSLQDYVDCPRRFQLRYLLRQPWPAANSEPLDKYEWLLEQSGRFHELAQRHVLGFPEPELTRGVDDPDLRRWWRNYLESPPDNLPTGVRQAEVTLSTPLSGFRLTARYDLIALDPGQRAVVVDWKTGKKRFETSILMARLQTKVYRYVLVEAGTALNLGNPILPDQVTMVYWFAEHPGHPASLPYDAASFAGDGAYLTDLIVQIVSRASNERDAWPLTTDERLCRFCNYRSLCDRGVIPGPVTESDPDQALELLLDFEFEEIEEIEY